MMKADSRQKIMDAAITEFATKGYAAASTNRICQQAAISKGLLFHYYKNKQTLYEEVLEQCVKDMEQASYLPRERLYAAPDIQEFCRRQMNFFAEHFEHYSIIGDLLWNVGKGEDSEREKLREKLISHKAERFRCFLNHCALRPEVDREVALDLILNATDQIQKKYMQKIHWRQEITEKALQEFREEYHQMLGMLLNGMVMPSEHRAGEDTHAASGN
ncbi:MAG: TetR/AcrR family transcriptional regulator [Candidatus Merdivicinus sp.]|jgi:TetR/AcrR family transcriptional regulator